MLDFPFKTYFIIHSCGIRLWKAVNIRQAIQDKNRLTGQKACGNIGSEWRCQLWLYRFLFIFSIPLSLHLLVLKKYTDVLKLLVKSWHYFFLFLRRLNSLQWNPFFSMIGKFLSPAVSDRQISSIALATGRPRNLLPLLSLDFLVTAVNGRA